MSQDEPEFAIRRILVALDASPHSRAAMEAAVELAARLEAEVLGMFIEDINLLRFAELPFAGEVTLASGTRRRLDVREIERELRAQEAQVQRALARAAERAHIAWSFQVTRGTIASELLNAATQMDLVILGRAGRSLGQGRRLGSTARAVASGATCLALILQYGSRLGMPVFVVYDGSRLAGKALAAATALAEDKEHLTVLLLADQPEAAEQLRARAAESLQTRGAGARYRVLAEPRVQKIVRQLESETCGVLVLPARDSLLQDEAVLDLVDAIEIPVLLVR